MPVWMQPEVDEALHMDHTVTPETVRATLEEHPDVKAVYVVSPTYYGVAADLGGHRRASRTRATFRCSSTRPGVRTSTFIRRCRSTRWRPAPTCASTRRTRCSAASRRRRCCTSKGARIRLDRLKAVVKLFLSTSPNLVLVASLDVARRQMATEGRALLSRTIELAERHAPAAQRDRRRLLLRRASSKGRPGVFDLDPTKITITVKELGYTGYEAEEILRRRYNVQCELADLFNCLALFTIGTTPEAADRLVYGVRELAREDRPIDVFSPSGVLERAVEDRHLRRCRRSRRCA